MPSAPSGSRTQRRPRAVAWAIGLAILIGLGSLGLTLLGLAARRVPPSTVWWLQPVALLLPLAAPVTGIAGLVWAGAALRTGRLAFWVIAGLHLVVAGVVLWRMVAGGGGGTAGEGPAIRVMSLNSAWSRRGEAGEIGRRFSDAQPHVVALQEISIRPGPSEGEWVAQGAGLALLKDSTYVLTTLDQPSDPSGWLTNGTALFARIPAGLSRPVLLDTVSATNSGKYTRTEVDWEGTEIAIYNVHFRSFAAPRPSGIDAGMDAWLTAFRASKEDFLLREAEARALRTVLDTETIPFIVVGDFNATPDQWSYAHVAHGLRDALNLEPGVAWTYPDARPLVRIDAILASSNWAVQSASVLPPGVSDHRPIVADLELVR